MFSKQLYHFIFLPAVCENSSDLATLRIIHLNRCLVVFNCDFNVLYYLNKACVESRTEVLFGEV